LTKAWDDDAWNDYLYWQTQDKKTLRKINSLLKDIDRSPFNGIGKPEPLRFEFSGYWSHRIDDFNRIVYRVKDNRIEIVQCGAHYRDSHPRE
jgi:toxin YoeB